MRWLALLLLVGCTSLPIPSLLHDRATVAETLRVFELHECGRRGLDVDAVREGYECSDPHARHWTLITDDGEHVTAIVDAGN